MSSVVAVAVDPRPESRAERHIAGDEDVLPGEVQHAVLAGQAGADRLRVSNCHLHGARWPRLGAYRVPSSTARVPRAAQQGTAV